MFAQSDSTLLLAPERLSERDILFRDLSKEEIKVISATRSPEAISNQPFSVWVITGEDILRNGFVTLADVLKAVSGHPGFPTRQCDGRRDFSDARLVGKPVCEDPDQ